MAREEMRKNELWNCGAWIVEEMERIMMILDQEGGRVWHKKQKARVETWNYTYFCYASAPSFCYIWHGYYYTVLFILGVRN